MYMYTYIYIYILTTSYYIITSYCNYLILFYGLTYHLIYCLTLSYILRAQCHNISTGDLHAIHDLRDKGIRCSFT